MRKMHWSEPYLNFIKVSILYNDESEQGWEYDCIQYESLEAVRVDMTNDFADGPPHKRPITLSFTRTDETYTTDVENTGQDAIGFTEAIFEIIQETLNGN